MFKRKNLFLAMLAAFAPIARGSVLHVFDPEDADAKAAIAAAVEAAVEKLDKKNKELLGELKKARKGADIDPAEHERLEAERDTLQGQLREAQTQLKAANKAAETAGATLAGEQAFNQRLLVDNGLNAALLEAGVKNPVHLKAAAAMLKSAAKVEVVVEGDNRKAVVNGKDLGAFVKEWSQSDEGKAFVSAPVNNGGGAGGGGGGQATGGNLGGTRAERATALAARHPELAANKTAA